jgi:hypothetical protein
MVIRRGRGVLVAVIAFGCLIATEFFTRGWFHDDTYYQQHGWPKLLGFLIAAVIVWLLLGRRSEEHAGTVVQATSNAAVLRREDQLFFISVQHWPLILCLLGAVFYFVRG